MLRLESRIEDVIYVHVDDVYLYLAQEFVIHVVSGYTHHNLYTNTVLFINNFAYKASSSTYLGSTIGWVLPPPGQDATNCYWNPGWWGGVRSNFYPGIFGYQRKISAESTVSTNRPNFQQTGGVCLFLVAKDIPS